MPTFLGRGNAGLLIDHEVGVTSRLFSEVVSGVYCTSSVCETQEGVKEWSEVISGGFRKAPSRRWMGVISLTLRLPVMTSLCFRPPEKVECDLYYFLPQSPPTALSFLPRTCLPRWPDPQQSVGADA